MKALPCLGLILACVVCPAVRGHAQLSPRLQQLRNPVFDHITSEHGLSGDAVLAILEDSRGFMWFGTQGGGLCRYDGKRILVYRHEEENSASISGNDISSLAEDSRRNILWIGTDKGLDAYDYSTGRFMHVLPDSADTTSLSKPRALCQDRDGSLWIAADGGLLQMQSESGGRRKIVRHVSDPGDSNSLNSNTILDLHRGVDGEIWIATGRGLHRFDSQSKKFRRFLFPAKAGELNRLNVVLGIESSNDGFLWLATNDGLVRFDTRKLLLQAIKTKLTDLTGKQLSSIVRDRDGNLWIGVAFRQLFVLDVETLQTIPLIPDPSDPKGLGSNAVACFYVDRHGSVWIGTLEKGISKLEVSRNKSTRLLHRPGDVNSLCGNVVFGLLEDIRGNLWIGTTRGLDMYDRRRGRFAHHVHNPENPWTLSNNCIVSITMDREGTIWAGSDHGLNRIDPVTGRTTRYYNEPKPPHLLARNAVSAVHQDMTGRIWVGTGVGLQLLDTLERKFETPLVFAVISGILEDRDGKTLWVGTTDKGLYRVDIGTGEVKRFSVDPRDRASTNEHNIQDLREDAVEPETFLWLATFGGGLYRFDKVSEKFTSFTERSGLADNTTVSLEFDKRGFLWVGTMKGISRFDPRTATVRNYDSRDGITNGEGNGHAILRTASGEIVLGTMRGVTIFHPDSVRDNPHIPPIVLTEIRIANRPVLPGGPNSPLEKTITETREIVLSYLDNIISFEFAALDFVVPSKNQYAYKMEGFDNDWIYSGSVRSATYTNLDPGTYLFRVKGSNNDGVWNEHGLSLSIVITPPWWKTSWAYVTYVIGLGAILYLFYRVRMRRLVLAHQVQLEHLEAEKMHELDRIKSRFFANISHEFRTPLTLILGPARQILEGSKEEETKTKADLIHRSARKLNQLVSELLDIAKIEGGEMKLKARPTNMVSAVNDITLSFQPLAERKKIALTVRSDNSEVIAWMEREKLDKILSNVLSNAFKFTPEGGHVDVSLRATPRRGERCNLTTQEEIASSLESTPRNDRVPEGFVTITVTDTGIGIPADQLDKIFDRFYQVDSGHTREHEGTGIGLSLTKELVELHKGRIEVESQEGKGSSFKLIFPLGRDHLKPEEICGEEAEEVHVPAERERVEVEDEPGTDARSSGGSALPTLLLVEDNADVRKYISMILEDHYRIIEAKNGEEGLDKACREIPDLIISDIMMPKMDGFELCRRLKSDTRTSHIPLIMLTAKATIGDKISGLELGADDYIMKPFEASELKARIRNLLDQRKRLQKYFREHGLFGIEESDIASVDQKFLQKAAHVIQEHLSDVSFGVEAFAEEMAVSRSLLFRKMEALVGEAPSELIKRTRLNKAAKLLEANAGNVSEIALEVGFSNPSYFAECFRKQFGVTPTRYNNSHSNSPS
jgi:signal transduction histidine kinase/ligand-binding sensor domain-containing protein/DNA-binding response OmpR family regulator